MSDSLTPICDLIEDLLSSGLSPEVSVRMARNVEVRLAMAARPRVNPEEQRKRWRLKAAARRSRLRGDVPDTSPGTKPDPILTKTQKVSEKVESKKEPSVPDVSGTSGDIPVDDWPDDFVERFWTAFPPYRRQAKAKVGQKLARIRAQTGKQKVTWATLFGGVLKFAATNPGEFAPAPMVWLNDGRWDREYGTGGSNGQTKTAASGKVGFAGIAARLRLGRAEGDGELPLDQPPGGPRR